MTRKEYEEFRYSYEHEQMSGGAFILVANNYIFNLEATIEAQNIIISDKTAIMEAMVNNKSGQSCQDCLFFIECKDNFHYCDRHPYLNGFVNSAFSCNSFKRVE